MNGNGANDNGANDNDTNDNDNGVNDNSTNDNSAENGNDNDVVNNGVPPALPAADDDTNRSTRKGSQFWHYVDRELRSLREYARNNGQNLPTEEALRRFFNVTFRDDIVRYRKAPETASEVENTNIQMPTGNMVEKPAWQDAIENAAVW